MFWIFGRKKDARVRVAKAIVDHVAFEQDHKIRQADELGRNSKLLNANHRTVKVDEQTSFIRQPGHYDADQKLERITGEVIRTYATAGKKPPRYVRTLVEEAI